MASGVSRRATQDDDICEERPIRVTLELGYGDCCLQDIGDHVNQVQSHIVNDTCHCDVSVGQRGEDSRMLHTRQDLTPACACGVFHAHGCIPHIKELRADSYLVRTHVADRDVLKDVIEDLRQLTDTVRLVRLVRGGDGGADEERRNVLFDLTILTKKQHETLEKAVLEGYYATPREISQQALADDLGISKATLSYHLKTAEAKLVVDLVDSLSS